MDMIYTEHQPHSRKNKQLERKRRLGSAAVHDASFAGQPDNSSQAGFMVLLGDTALYNEPAITHLIEWNSK